MSKPTTTSLPFKRLFVLDSNAPWIRSLLHAMPARVEVRGLRVYNAFSFPGGWGSLFRKAFRQETVHDRWHDLWVPIPGWNKAFALSTQLVSQAVRRLSALAGQPDVVLFTLPWYAAVAERLTGCKKVYYAHDTFRFYGWNSELVIRREAQLLNACGCALAVAAAVAEDLTALSPTPVHYFPMATSWLPGQMAALPPSACPADLSIVPLPRIGCIGQIGSSYDWELVEQVQASLPGCQFVYIGPLFQEGAVTDAIRKVLSAPNAHHLGPKPHADLPAYLRCFNVCWSPLKVNDHNNRRSPLRLFDYMTTDRPIISTAIREALGHIPYLDVVSSPQECVTALKTALQSGAVQDLRGRWDYITRHTWAARSKHFWELVEE